MFNRLRNFSDPKTAAEDAAVVEMLQKTQAMISFEPDGTILHANDVFLGAMGYKLDEIVGKHHRMFCSPQFAASSDYTKFWQDLAAGHSHFGEFERFGKNKESIWISATYAPVRDSTGRVIKVVKLAQDVTDRHLAMEQFQEALERLGSGESGARMNLPAKSGFHAVAQNFNKAMCLIESELSKIRTRSTEVRDDAKVRRKCNAELMESAALQEDRIRQMSDLTTIVAETMDRAKSTVGTAMDQMEPALDAIEQGQKLVETAKSSTQSLEEKAKSMSEINRMIDDLSFQTNLLALNAGVEAARAGEAGAGFSVVASEIRSLAQQSSSASAQINDLIRETTETSSKAADDVGAGSEVFNTVKGHLSGLKEIFAPVVTELAEQVSQSSLVDKMAAESLRGVEKDSKLTKENMDAATNQIDKLGGLSDDLSQIVVRFADA